MGETATTDINVAMHYLKRAPATTPQDQRSLTSTVETLLQSIKTGGRDRVLELAATFDDFHGDPRLEIAKVEALASSASSQICRDIDAAHARIQRFAQAQLESVQDFEVELEPGLIAGQRLVPVSTAGCYIPGGRYAHIASALMSITTARVAGVPWITASTPPRDGVLDPVMAYAIAKAGADEVLLLGGVQAIGAMAYGIFGRAPADLLVGPGNAYVSEAKRQLFGEVGIDMFAGPTEILVVADDTADPDVVAEDLVSQAEHGPDSPAWLVTTDDGLANAVLERVPALIAALPSPSREAAEYAWQHRGEVVIATTREEAAAAADRYAPEHLEVMAADLPWWHGRLRNYGSLFLGPETTVSFGDKCTGPNHILPTRGAARYTGGLSVHKFLKKLTYQKMSGGAAARLAPEAARICRAEGMEAHARAVDLRASKDEGNDAR